VKPGADGTFIWYSNWLRQRQQPDVCRDHQGADLTPIISGVKRSQARAVEKVLIEHYGFERVGGTTMLNGLASCAARRQILMSSSHSGSGLLS
jgi:hypothetical protein